MILTREPFERRAIVLAPGGERLYDESEWHDTLIVVMRGELELEGVGGERGRFARGAVLALAGLPLRALHNGGQEPVLLLAISRR